MNIIDELGALYMECEGKDQFRKFAIACQSLCDQQEAETGNKRIIQRAAHAILRVAVEERMMANFMRVIPIKNISRYLWRKSYVNRLL